jgi:hypothetical protein
MVNDLMLLAGIDIPFPEAGLFIHQPTLKEIGIIGEEMFFSGCGVLNFSKEENLSLEDRNNLANMSDFEVLMSMMTMSYSEELKQSRICATAVLSLLFPAYEIHFQLDAILLEKEDELHSINSENFEDFKEILAAMFCLHGRGGEDDSSYRPGGRAAEAIAEKLRKRKQILAEQKSGEKISIFNRFASIFAVGMRLNINEVLNYTVYQLYDQFDRFELKDTSDIHFKAQLAGARDLEKIDNWRKDLHP